MSALLGAQMYSLICFPYLLDTITICKGQLLKVDQSTTLYAKLCKQVKNDVTDNTCRRCAEINVIKTKKNVMLNDIFE